MAISALSKDQRSTSTELCMHDIMATPLRQERVVFVLN